MTSSKVRCFLAIDIDSQLISNMKTFKNELQNTNAEIKYVNDENIHYTLKFFGDIDENQIDKISSHINEVIINYSPISLAISGSGSFPNEEYIKVIWTGISHNENLINLQKDLDEKFHTLGFKKEKNHSPHLTIGRMKNAKKKEDVKKILDDFKNKDFGNMTISKLSLKKSQLTPQGPLYSEIKSFTFN